MLDSDNTLAIFVRLPVCNYDYSAQDINGTSLFSIQPRFGHEDLYGTGNLGSNKPMKPQ